MDLCWEKGDCQNSFLNQEVTFSRLYNKLLTGQ